MAKSTPRDTLDEIERENLTECVVAAVLAIATTTGKVRVTPAEAYRAYKEMLDYVRAHKGVENPVPEP